MADYKKIKICRVCKSDNLNKVIDFKKIPLANNFSNTPTKKYPLEINNCNECNHSQLSLGVNPKILFSEYLYRSSFSKSYDKHNRDLVNTILSKKLLGKKSIIFDIGSNDGLLLKYFKKKKVTCIGVEPSKNLSKIANENGLKTENIFFDCISSKTLKKKYGQAKVITANNVFAHIYNFDDFILGVKNLLSEEGVFIAEVSYLKDVINKNLFDTIYHEHIDYHLITCLKLLFQRFEMYLYDCEFISTHGGSIRIFCSKSKKNVTNTLKKALNNEIRFIRNIDKQYIKFNKKIDAQKNKINKLLKSYQSKKYDLICYGASAKATIFINLFKIGSSIKFCLDDTKIKHAKLVPGTKIEIVDPNSFKFKSNQVIIITAWNFADEIIKKIRKIDKKINIISPLPFLKVHK